MLVQNRPNTIWLAGNATEDGNVAAAAAITPGMLIELYTASGVSRWRPSTLADKVSNTFAMQQVMMNKGVDDVYNVNDLVQAGIATAGCIIWGLMASGASFTKGQALADAGNGMFKAAGGGVTNARAYETLDNTTGSSLSAPALLGAARIRVEFL